MGSVANGTPAGAIYSNANTATLGVTGITAAGSYQYRSYITNCGGGNNATSNAATLTVNPTPAVVITNPAAVVPATLTLLSRSNSWFGRTTYASTGPMQLQR